LKALGANVVMEWSIVLCLLERFFN
jgi:hypothetical protein